MGITITGLVLILLGLYSALFNQRFLYRLTIFFIPFTATAVLNVGGEGEGSSIQPFMFFGGLWMFTLLLSKGKRVFKAVVSRPELYTICLLSGFLLVALVSLAMPIIINGRLMANQTGALDELVPVTFSSKNITQYVYLLFGAVFSIAIFFYNKRSKEVYKATIKTYTLSVLFVIFWGLLQLTSNLTPIPYPAAVFNNSNSKYAEGYLQVLENESAMKRISSVAVEPSVMVQSILLILPFLLYAVFYGEPILGKRIDKAVVALITVFIFLSTSSGGILTLVILGMLFMYNYIRAASLVKKILIICSSLVAIPLFAFIAYMLFGEIINSALFEKSDTYSALERLGSITMGWENFLQRPVLGLGWGAVTSLDLVVKILSNTGIIGFIFFGGWLIKLIASQVKSLKRKRLNFTIHSAALLSLYGLLFSNGISGFSYVFGYFWLIVGLVTILRFNNICNEVTVG